MRVALIIYGSINTITGGYIYDRKLVEYLESQGANVKIFSQQNNSVWQRLKNNFSRSMLNEIIQFSPDIILQDGMNFLSLFLFNKRLKRRCHCPIIGVVNLVHSCIENNSLKKILIQKIEKIYFKSLHGFIFISLSTKAAVTNLIGTAKNSLVAYPGKDRFKLNVKLDNLTLKANHNHFRVMFIGNLNYNKGLHILLKALAQIEHHLWQLSVIGSLQFDLDYTKTIITMIQHLRLDDNVKLLGILNDEELKEQLISHHVLAVPSYYESFGMVYVEAMGAGLPVIASDLGGAKEIITHQINGFLVNPGNINMVREALSQLILDRELLIKMGCCSLHAYNKIPSWNESMERIYLFLTDI